jgi:hypothetical protein
MNLCEVNAVVFQTYTSNALALPPSTSPVQLAQTLKLSNLGSDRKGLNVADFADKGEEHDPNGIRDGW